MVQLSHMYMTTGKTVALTIWTLVGKVTSLLFNTLSRFVIAILPRSKHPSISWLQSPSTLILQPKEIKSDTVSHFPHLFATKWLNQMPLSSFSECCISQLFHSPFSPSSRGSFYFFFYLFFFFGFFFFFFFKFYFIFKLYITVLDLPNIKMNPPQVYMC